MISGIIDGHFDIIGCLEIRVSAPSYHISYLKKNNILPPELGSKWHRRMSVEVVSLPVILDVTLVK